MQFFPAYPFSSPFLPVPQFHPSFGGPPHAEVYFGPQPIYEATSLTPSPHHLYWDIRHKLSALHNAVHQLAAFLPISPAFPSPTASTPEQIVHNRIPTRAPQYGQSSLNSTIGLGAGSATAVTSFHHPGNNTFRSNIAASPAAATSHHHFSVHLTACFDCLNHDPRERSGAS